jgi:hypothetical protein
MHHFTILKEIVMETSSAYSESYLAVEQRIRVGELSLSELEHLLDGLVSQEQITSAEQQALLELAWSVNTTDMPASKDV